MSSSIRNWWKKCVLPVLTLCFFSGLWALLIPSASTVGAQTAELIELRVRDEARFAALRDAFSRGLPYVPGELLVRFKPGSEPGHRAGALAAIGSDVRQENGEWIGDLLHLKGLAEIDPLEASRALENQPEIAYAQPNYITPLKAVPNDANYSQQWHLDAINAPRAWDINPGGRSDVLVAVLDSGLTTTTNTYAFRIWTGTAFQILPVPFAQAMDFDHARVRAGEDFVFDWRTPAGGALLFDAVGHGSHVAGTIAQQTNNGVGYAGVAHATTILPLKVCVAYWDLQLAFGADGIGGFVSPDAGGCTIDAEVEALRHAADSGAKVINMSLGGPGGSPAVEEALRYAVSRGAFVSIAAGNEALEGNPTSYPAAYAPAIDGVVAVGAVNRGLTRARYSNFGPYVELVAPGGDGGSTVNDVWQVGPLQSDLRFLLRSPRFDRYEPYGASGTSMAAPHVAGVAALLYSQGVTNPAAIEAALKRFARDLGPAGRDDEYGHGLIDARATLRGLGVAR